MPLGSYALGDDYGLLLWWTLDSVPPPLVIKPKVVKEAVQWRSERRVQMQSYVNQNEMTSELWSWTYKAMASLLLNGTFVGRTTDLEKTVNMNWLPFSLSVTTSIDAFLYEGNVWAHVNFSLYHAIHENPDFTREQPMHPPKIPQKPNFIVIGFGLRMQTVLSFLWIRNVMYCTKILQLYHVTYVETLIKGNIMRMVDWWNRSIKPPNIIVNRNECAGWVDFCLP